MTGYCSVRQGTVVMSADLTGNRLTTPHRRVSRVAHMCGIFGIFGHPEAARLAYLGLHALQHRGQESAGISAADGHAVRTYRGMGSVVDVFDEETLGRLGGHAAAGHVRYSTAGESDAVNAQPVAIRYHGGHLALAHNGNLVNAGTLRSELEAEGSIFSTNLDSEVFVHLVARQRQGDVIQSLSKVLPRLKGAYSVLLLTPTTMIAARDPLGFRPLAVGKIERSAKEGGSREAWVFASETCAFSLIGAQFVRSLAPGEIAVVDESGMRTHQPGEKNPKHFCVFEHIYFARPDSVVGEQSVYYARRRLGRQLAKEQPAEADIVIPVPDSGTTAAMGYAETAGIPYEMGLVRSHYVGRTFIEPQQSIRNFGVKLKLATVRPVIEGKRVVVIDDSLVRGTTSRKIVDMVRQAGAREVHVRISAPPTTHSCFYGIDTPTREELIASKMTVEEIRAFIGADSLGYLSMDGMLEAVKPEHGGFCHACFSGEYPVPIEPQGKCLPLPLLGRRLRAR